MIIDKQVEPLAETSQTRSFPRLFFVLLVLLGVFVVLTVLVYRAPVTNPFVRAVSSVIPFPAVMVNSSIITLEAYGDERQALMQYLTTTGMEQKPSEEVIQQTILDALVNKAAIRALAFEKGVKIDTSRVDQYYQDVIATQESEEAFAKELKESFGWKTRDFKERIIKSIVLALQMSEYVLSNEELQKERRVQIMEAQKKLEAGDLSVLNQDLGYQTAATFTDPWASVELLPIGGRSGIIDSEAVLMIYYVQDRIETAEEKQIHLKAALVWKKTLENLVDDYLATAKVRYFVK